MKPAGTCSGARVTSTTPRARDGDELEVGCVRDAEHRGVVHAGLARARGTAPRGECRARRGCVRAAWLRRGKRGAHLGGRVADQRRQQRGRAEAPVRRSDGGDRLGRRRVVEKHVAAAVHLDVDEPRREPRSLRQDGRPVIAAGTSPLGTTATMRAVLDDHGAVLLQASAVEQGARPSHAVTFAGSLIACASPSADGADGRRRRRGARPSRSAWHRSSGSGRPRRSRDDPAPARAGARRRPRPPLS